MNDELKERVKALAVEAGIDITQDTLCRHETWEEPMIAFAQAVARECAKLADDSDHGPLPHNIGGQIRARYGLSD